jgi:predicted nuclease of predicted toxin-antitoxin system
MKLLLDESLPIRLKQDLSAFSVKTVKDMGWAGKQNGELLLLAQDHFDAFITADQNLQYQQNLVNYEIAVLILAANSNRYADLRQLVPKVLEQLHKVKKGKAKKIF